MYRFGLGFWLFIASLLFTACGKEDDNAQPQPENTEQTNGAGQFKAEVNGVPWQATSAYASQVNTYGLTIIGQFNNEAISITTNAVINPGTFDAFSYLLLTGAFAINQGNSTDLWTTLQTHKCQLQIQKLDWVGKKISGTFAFTADSQGVAGMRGVKTITKGTFTDLPLLANIPLNFSLSAQVNNQPFVGAGMYFNGFLGSYSLDVSDTNGHSLHLTGLDLTKTGPQAATSAIYAEAGSNPYDFWSAPQNNPATVTITQFDAVNGTASGTFAFAAEPSMSGAAPKTISQGTFTNVPVF